MEKGNKDHISIYLDQLRIAEDQKLLIAIYNARFYNDRGDHVKALEMLKKVDLNENKNEMQLLRLYKLEMGRTYRKLGMFKESKDILFDSALTENVSDRYYLARLYYEQSVIYGWEGNFERSNIYLEKLIDLVEMEKNKYLLGITYDYVGSFNLIQGKIEIAIQAFNKGISYFQQVGNVVEHVLSLNRLASAYYSKGEIKKSIDIVNESQELLEINKVQSDNTKMIIHITSSRYYYQVNQFQTAFDKICEVIKIINTKGSLRWLYFSYYHLIRIHLAMNHLDNARSCFKQFQIISDKTSMTFYKVYLEIANAKILYKENNLESLVESKRIINSILKLKNESLFFYEIKYEAYVLKIRILMQEYRLFNEKSLIDEILDIIENLVKESYQRNSYIDIVNSMILNSRLDIILGNLNDAEKLLKKAHELCVKNDLKLLETEIEKEISLFYDRIENWNLIIESSNIIERIKEVKFEKFLNLLLKIDM